MVGGNGDTKEASNRLGIPTDLILEADGFRDSDSGIFPDNAQIVAIFSDMLTQWRVGPCGATGLDYSALKPVFKFRKIKRKKEADIFDGVQVMERAALEEMSRMRGN